MPYRVISNKSPNFKDAWENFSHDVDTSKIKTFQQLFYQFMMWGGKHTPMTKKQTDALKYQAYKNHIGYIDVRKDRRGINHYRNVGTGRFESKFTSH